MEYFQYRSTYCNYKKTTNSYPYLLQIPSSRTKNIIKSLMTAFKLLFRTDAFAFLARHVTIAWLWIRRHFENKNTNLIRPPFTIIIISIHMSSHTGRIKGHYFNYSNILFYLNLPFAAVKLDNVRTRVENFSFWHVKLNLSFTQAIWLHEKRDWFSSNNRCEVFFKCL